MKGGKRPLGYTIIEVMIVLAVSGIMFLIAADFISGKAERTSFTQGVNEMASRIQDVINQVIDGQYSDVPLNCSVVGGSLSFSGLPSGGQGTNPGCVFIGKVLHFSVSGVPHDYEVISVAGLRVDGSGLPTQNLGTGAHGAEAQYIPSLTIQQIVPQQLDIQYIKIIDSSGIPQSSFGIGFMQSLASVNRVKVLNNLAQTVSMYYVSGLTSNMSGDDTGGTGEQLILGNLYSTASADICLTDGTRWADIAIGTDGTNTNDSQLNVTVNMDQSGSVVPPKCM